MSQPSEERPKRLYGKDITPPEAWLDYIADNVHSYVTQPVSMRADALSNRALCWKKDGDILGEVPKENQAESVMIYVGYAGTQTPAHKVC